MWYRGLMLVCSIVFVASANAQQQQDTTKHGWGIVYSSPKSRASTATPAQGITQSAPPAPTQSQVTTLPTIRGTPAKTAAPVAAEAAAPALTPPVNGTYMGDRGPAAAPAVAAQGTYDTVPPAPANGGSGVHLDELMSLHEYTATGLTSLKPQEVQALETWLERYRANLIDSVTRATQRATTSQAMPVATPAPTAVANTRAAAPVNTHTVTGIRSGSRFVQIDDGSVWDIYPADQSETAAWQVGDNVTVRVAAQAYGEFDHELVNGQRTGPVRAKFMGYARGQ